MVNRAALYSTVTGDVTGSQGNNLSRIGAGDLSASRLFDRFGQGIVIRQLITDLAAPQSGCQRAVAGAGEAQSSQATRFDVLLAVNRAYFGVLNAQSVVTVAEKTVAARQLLSDQVTELGRNNLKSQLDVSFAEVNVSEAKLLLLRAQDAVQQALAELGRAMGSDQPANFQLTIDPFPPVRRRPIHWSPRLWETVPELAGLRFSRDAAYKFAEAEKDLSRPTVSAVGVGGLIPFINTPAASPFRSNTKAPRPTSAFPS